MPDINKEYEREHLRNLVTYQKQVEAEYMALIDRVFRSATGLRPSGDTFRITDNPSFAVVVETELTLFRENVQAIVVRGIRSEWDLSGAKNDALVLDKYGRPVNATVQAYQRTAAEEAYTRFVNRKINKLTLSDRVWNLSNQLQSEIEKTVFTHLQEGKSATQMATDMKKHLKEPNRLFRRVRDAEGKLRLSKAAKEYKPGTGVYRSSYQNALRMTATETNRAYRGADMARWSVSKFILGYEVRLSNRHPKYDECDVLAGEYPTTFVFTSWHPRCLCNCIPILPSEDEYRQYELALLNGTDKGFKFQNVRTEPHAGLQKYLEDNKEMLARRKTPLWMLENKKFVNKD